MPAYQLQIKQVVDYPRCRIYRQFIHRLIDDRSIRASGGSGLFIIPCFAALQTSAPHTGELMASATPSPPANGSVRSKSFLNGFGLVFSVRRFPSWESFSSVISLTSPLWGEEM